MKLELHLLQNFAPSCLNRDDTGSPKDCEFGGFRRARISSQCLKRSIRQAFDQHKLLAPGELAVRTKRLAKDIAETLQKQHHKDLTQALLVAQAAILGAGLAFGEAKEGEEPKTQYLLFLPKRRIEQMAALLAKHWDKMLELGESKGAEKVEEAPAEASGKGAKAKAKTGKQKKAEAEKNFPADLGKELQALFEDGRGSPELALFGRMIADKSEWNTDAACQVAHALSTHRATMEFDFYTAVDDLKPNDNQGADMMGTVQFNSACFYRYALVDLDQLGKNLAGPDASDENTKTLSQKALAAFVRASLLAIPTGKQNSMAAQNLPSFVLAVLRGGAPWSLANAFLKPVRASAEGDVMSASIEALDKHAGDLAKMYGSSDIHGVFVCALDNEHLKQLPNLGASGKSLLHAKLSQGTDNIEALVSAIGHAAFGAAS